MNHYHKTASTVLQNAIVQGAYVRTSYDGMEVVLVDNERDGVWRYWTRIDGILCKAYDDRHGRTLREWAMSPKDLQWRVTVDW